MILKDKINNLKYNNFTKNISKPLYSKLTINKKIQNKKTESNQNSKSIQNYFQKNTSDFYYL